MGALHIFHTSAQLTQRHRATAVWCAYVGKVHCAVVRTVFYTTSFGNADSVRYASMHVDGIDVTTGYVSLSQYFRWIKHFLSYMFRLFHFQRTACNATQGIALAILSVRPSVCQMRVL